MTRRSTAMFAMLATIAVLAAPAAAHHGHRKAKKHRMVTAPPPAAARCVGDPRDVQSFDITVDGQAAHGLVVYPAKRPRGLVVFFHGFGHTTESWRHHLTNVATRNHVVAVAMDYRGTYVTTGADGKRVVRGWQVAEGAVDSIAAVRHLEDRCGSFRTVIAYSVSMGSNAAGLALAAQPKRRGDRPMFDWWFNIEGAVNVTETYLEAKAVEPSGNDTAVRAVGDIERQMGGTFADRSEVYLSRTVVNRVPDIVASGVRGVTMVHGVMDGVVPYNQSRELRTLLLRYEMPVDFYTVLRKDATSEPGTPIDSYVGGYVPGYSSPFAGHGSEKSTTHIVIRTGLALLDQMLSGKKPPTCAEHVLDDATNEGTTHAC